MVKEDSNVKYNRKGEVRNCKEANIIADEIADYLERISVGICSS